MTEYQQKIFDALKRGSKLQWEISGFYYRHKLLRVETVDALIDTGELAAVATEGRLSMRNDFIIHKSQVETFSTGRKVLEVRCPFSLGLAK